MHRYTLRLLYVLTLFLALPIGLFALPPQDITYQAYLKDGGGLPVNGTHDIHFRLYGVATGGTPLWSDTRRTDVVNGLFTVKLGSATHPLPVTAFQSETWLGIEVGSDGEALPRTAMSSVSNAFYSQDADTVDGLHAVEILGAAQGGATVITDLPYTVTAPGSYLVTQNLDGSAGGIDIQSDDVTIDLGGFVLDGVNGLHTGIHINQHRNVTITDGTVRKFATAIAAFGSDGHSTLSRLGIRDNTAGGIHLADVSGHISHCLIENNAGVAIHAGEKSRIHDNVLFNNSGMYAIHVMYGSLIYHNSLSANATFTTIWSPGSTVSDNVIAPAFSDFVIQAHDGAMIRDNVITAPSADIAIEAGFGTRVTGNTLFYCSASTACISASGSGASVTGNSISSMSGNTAIESYGGNLISRNTIEFGSYGIRAQDDVVASNSVMHAGTGIVVQDRARVTDNDIAECSNSAIEVQGSGNILTGNRLTSSGVCSTGIRFSVSGNYYGDNIAHGHAVDFEPGGTTQADGGGNVSF